MKLAFVYSAYFMGGRLFDFSNLWDSPRGLTGSEVSFIAYAVEMVRRGHSVDLFTERSDDLGEWNGMRLFPSAQVGMIDASYDATVAWNEPDVLRSVSSKLRVVNQQLNDFNYCHPGFDDVVDVYTSPSESHLEFISQFTPHRSKWEVMPNGCYPDHYSFDNKIQGRVIYASSPDRGLHLLLQIWPNIKKAVPEAHLRIFYNIDDWINRAIHIYSNPGIDHMEQGCRARYIKLALEKYANLNIEKVGSVSRTKMSEEMSKAQVLAYPCDTVRFTEGFSVTTLEACASRTVPLISSVDSLGQIYGEYVPITEHPIKDRLREFENLVIKSIQDKAFRQGVVDKAHSISSIYAWDNLAIRLESLLERRLCAQS